MAECFLCCDRSCWDIGRWGDGVWGLGPGAGEGGLRRLCSGQGLAVGSPAGLETGLDAQGIVYSCAPLSDCRPSPFVGLPCPAHHHDITACSLSLTPSRGRVASGESLCPRSHPDVWCPGVPQDKESIRGGGQMADWLAEKGRVSVGDKGAGWRERRRAG